MTCHALLQAKRLENKRFDLAKSAELFVYVNANIFVEPQFSFLLIQLNALCGYNVTLITQAFTLYL